ncbi:unnamed protein product [Urochloa humidicola]
MVAILRQNGYPAPAYGDNTDEFTIEVHHGGFFLGSGHLRTYVDEKVSWFDHCEVDTWSPLWFDDFIEQLGYTKTPLLQIYWLLPGKQVADGLRVISTDSDTNVMCQVADKVKNLVVYFDHDDIVQTKDCVTGQVTDFLGVVQEKSNGIEDGSNDDTEFFDSDFEFMDGDDDLFVANIDEDVEDQGLSKGKQIAKGKKAIGSRLRSSEIPRTDDDGDEISTDEEGLQLPHEVSNGHVSLMFKSFRTEDMDNPTFKVGMFFESVEALRSAITEYSVKNRVEIKMPRNDRQRIRAHCADGCPWNLYASWDSRVKTFMVKTYFGKHNCHKRVGIEKVHLKVAS